MRSLCWLHKQSEQSYFTTDNQNLYNCEEVYNQTSKAGDSHRRSVFTISARSYGCCCMLFDTSTCDPFPMQLLLMLDRCMIWFLSSCLIQIAIDNLTNTVLTNVFLSLSATNLFLQCCDIVIICLTQTFQVNNKCMVFLYRLMLLASMREST